MNQMLPPLKVRWKTSMLSICNFLNSFADVSSIPVNFLISSKADS